jgi:hypothetical protein
MKQSVLRWWPRDRRRVPTEYLTDAFLAILADREECGMNNLRFCNGLDGSIPTAHWNSFVRECQFAPEIACRLGIDNDQFRFACIPDCF